MREQGYMLPKTYRKVGLGFFVLAIIAFGSVFYLIWAKVTIIITPAGENISKNFSFNVREPDIIPSLDQDEVIPGKIKLVKVQGSDVFEASGINLIESDAVGVVTVFNNYSKGQPLIATTRLASPDDPDTVLVRLKEDIDIDPGQQIKVQVYTDDPDSFEDIKPMKFIIPGLWLGLQDKIYAESYGTLSSEGYKVSVVTQEDLDKALVQLEEMAYQRALIQVNQELETQETLWPKLVSTKIVELTYGSEVGDEVVEFTASIDLATAIVIFDESKLISMARKKLKNDSLPGSQSIDLNPSSFSYTVESHNFETQEAEISVSMEGTSVIANSLDSIDKGELVGKTEEEVKEYFSQFDEVESVEIKFQPAWLKKIPRIKSKINLEIAE